MLKIVLSAGAAMLLLSSVSMAQVGPAAKACAGDIKTLCAGVQPGEGRVRACIKAHVKDLSEPCQAVLTKAAAIGKACRADAKQLCADVKPGGGRVGACIKAHMGEISEACKDALAQASAGKT
jgi:hypothetical protein